MKSLCNKGASRTFELRRGRDLPIPLKGSARKLEGSRGNVCKTFEVGTDEQDIYNVINYISATKTAKPLELVLEKAERPVFRNAGNGKEIAVKGCSAWTNTT